MTWFVTGTAFTKLRLPSAVTRVEAKPRVKPPPALRHATGEPTQPVTASRTWSGRSGHDGRTAVAW